MAKRTNKAAMNAVKAAGSINKLAAACGVTRQAVQGWIKNGINDVSRIRQVAKITGLPIDSFF